jgi:hypothetical protein
MILIAMIAGLAAAVLLTVAPFFLSWPRRLRWLIAVSNVPDPWGIGPGPWSGLEEMTLETVIPEAGGLLVVGLSRRSLRSLWMEGATEEQAGILEGWTATGTPLLEVHAGDGTVTLHGPTSCVPSLRALAAQNGQSVEDLPRALRP